MLNPEEQLQRQAAIARAVHQQRSVDKSRQHSNTHAVSLGFDADTGMEVIQLSDGSIHMAHPITTGARGTGDTLLLHQGQGAATVDAPPVVKRPIQKPAPKQKQVTYPFKVLFAIKEDGRAVLYIGGDRASATKLVEIPLS